MKKRLVSMLALAIILVMMFTAFSTVAVAASEAKTLKVTTTTYLNSKASTASKTRICKVPAGTFVTQISTGTYYFVQFGAQKGYIKKSCLSSSWGYGAVGAIKIDDTKVDYNVAIGNDNEYYMTRNSKDKKAAAGAIYFDFRNLDEDRRMNLILYGHNMRNGSMFADLHKYEDASFFSSNGTVKLSFTGTMGFDKASSKYTVFAQGEFPLTSTLNPWRTQFESQAELSAHIQAIYDNCKAQGGNVSSSAPTTAKQILTLSTCVYPRSTEKRYIVFAYKN